MNFAEFSERQKNNATTSNTQQDRDWKVSFFNLKEGETTCIKFDNVTISEELNDVNGTETNYGLTGKFKGVLAKTTVPNNGLFISGNKFYYSKGNTKIKAFRGWFNLEAVLNVAASAPVFFSFDNETTSINMVKGERNISNGEVYNLNGHRVMSPNKGLFIKNGKKVIVK